MKNINIGLWIALVAVATTTISYLDQSNQLLAAALIVWSHGMSGSVLGVAFVEQRHPEIKNSVSKNAIIAGWSMGCAIAANLIALIFWLISNKHPNIWLHVGDALSVLLVNLAVARLYYKFERTRWSARMFFEPSVSLAVLATMLLYIFTH